MKRIGPLCADPLGAANGDSSAMPDNPMKWRRFMTGPGWSAATVAMVPRLVQTDIRAAPTALACDRRLQSLKGRICWGRFDGAWAMRACGFGELGRLLRPL